MIGGLGFMIATMATTALLLLVWLDSPTKAERARIDRRAGGGDK